ncbi:MAG: head decoration protein [Gammaproteobacteria bacterium]|nr:head decoration protein [Betaproteobacteria bacterium]MBM4211976.1 head decoration protein [Gammaproteobacteria bacterium]
MTVAIEQNNLGDLLKFEAPNLYSREEITVAQGQKLALGAIIGQDIETDLIKALNPAATDGTQNALGALIAEVDATSSNTKAVIVTRDAILADHAVIWPSAITLEQKTAAIKQLEARGVIIRKGV